MRNRYRTISYWPHSSWDVWCEPVSSCLLGSDECSFLPRFPWSRAAGRKHLGRGGAMLSAPPSSGPSVSVAPCKGAWELPPLASIAFAFNISNNVSESKNGLLFPY